MGSMSWRGVSAAVMAGMAVMVVVACARQEPQPHSDPSLLPSDPGFLEHGRNYYSPRGEERIIRHFFQDRRGGAFLDVGAAHHRKQSTTYYLEKHLDWSGVAIGVGTLPEHQHGHIKHRPRTIFLGHLVATTTLGEISERAGLAGIDFATLNLDASAAILLAGFDIQRLQPELVRVRIHPSTSGQVMAYFAEHGYERIDPYLRHDDTSWYFRPRAR